MNANARGAVLALLAFAVYSTHDVVVKTLGASYSPLQIVFFANLFGFPVVTVMMMRDRAEGNLRPKHPWWTTLRVAAALVSTTLAFYAFSQLPMAQTYALIFAAPLLITMLSVPVLGETVGWRRSLAVAVGLVGVLVVLRPGATELTTGHAAALGAAVCSAIGAIVMRKIGQDERSAVMLLYPMMANFLVMACLLGFVYQPMPVIHLGGTGLMAVLGFVGGLCIIGAYREGRAVIVAPMQYSQILWAVLYGYAFFGEVPDRATALGAAIIILSGVYIVLREDKVDVSKTRPVLQTRTRAVAGTYPRVESIRHLFRKRLHGGAAADRAEGDRAGGMPAGAEGAPEPRNGVALQREPH